MPEFSKFPDIEGDPDFNDPLDNTGLDSGATEAGDAAAELIKGDLANPSSNLTQQLPDVVKAKLPDIISESISGAITDIPLNDGVVSKGIAREAIDTFKDPAELKQVHDSALADAITEKGSIQSVSAEDLKTKYDAQVKAKVEQIKVDTKVNAKEIIQKVLPEADVKSVSNMVDRAVDDPRGFEADTEAEGKALEAEHPDLENDPAGKNDSTWKDKVKTVMGYGAKAFMILAVISAIIPGASSPIDYLAKTAGEVVVKVVKAVADILQAFLGPFIKAFWDLVKKLKGPLVILGIILLIILVVWIYKSVLKKST